MKRVINYIKMKLFYYNMKKAVFEMANNADDVINFITNLAISCKDMTGNDLRKEVIHAIAELAHEEGQKLREAEKKSAE